MQLKQLYSLDSKQFSSMVWIRNTHFISFQNKIELAIPMWSLQGVFINSPPLLQYLNHRSIPSYRRKYLPKEIPSIHYPAGTCWDTWGHNINESLGNFLTLLVLNHPVKLGLLSPSWWIPYIIDIHPITLEEYRLGREY